MVQLLISVYLFKIIIVDQMNQLKNSIYNENEVESKDWGTPLMNFIKKYGGILLGLSILNRWTFNFGEFSKDNPGLMILLRLFTSSSIVKNTESTLILLMSSGMESSLLDLCRNHNR